MLRNDGTRKCFTLASDYLLIGRLPSCDLRIPLASVSRRHCELRIVGDQVILRDLGSSNGTFLNNTRIQEAQVHAGDRIRIGPVTFLAVVNGEPAEVMDDSTIEQIPVAVAHRGGATGMSSSAGGGSSGASGVPGPSVAVNGVAADDELDDPLRSRELSASDRSGDALPLEGEERS